MNESLTVKVAKDIADLIPTFMNNRRKEVEALQLALGKADFDQLRHLGHRMKGVGNSYGFERISVFGKSIEDHARSGDRAGLDATIAAYREFLANVQVVYE